MPAPSPKTSWHNSVLKKMGGRAYYAILNHIKQVTGRRWGLTTKQIDTKPYQIVMLYYDHEGEMRSLFVRLTSVGEGWVKIETGQTGWAAGRSFDVKYKRKIQIRNLPDPDMFDWIDEEGLAKQSKIEPPKPKKTTAPRPRRPRSRQHGLALESIRDLLEQ